MMTQAPMFFPTERDSVLIVEDEPLVRRFAADIVQEAGYTAIEAESAEDALDLLENEPGIKLMFADIGLSNQMDGIELASIVRARWPSIDIILTSGNQIEQDITFPGRKAFVVKPYDSAATAALIREILNTAPLVAHAGTESEAKDQRQKASKQDSQ